MIFDFKGPLCPMAPGGFLPLGVWCSLMACIGTSQPTASRAEVNDAGPGCRGITSRIVPFRARFHIRATYKYRLG
jgi:hypothetical protein